MKIGIHLPQWGPLAERSAVLTIARHAEQTGLDSVWVADHIVYPLTSRSQYPYRSKGLPFAAADGFLEALTQLAVVAGATESVELGTSVLVLPMREPLLLAKTVATLDVLCGGRVQLAVGAGWWQEEFAAVNATFEGRGARMDEQLDILKAAWTGTAAHRGDNYQIAPVACLPRPQRAGGPPLLIGGNGPRSWRRAATRGDGWHAVGLRPPQLREGVEQTRALADAAGRQPDELTFSTSSGTAPTTEQTVARLAEFHEAGVDQVVLNIDTEDLTGYLAAIENLGTVHAQVRTFIKE